MLLICEKRSAKNRRFMAGVVELSTAPNIIFRLKTRHTGEGRYPD